MSFAFDCQHLYQYCSPSIDLGAYCEQDLMTRPMVFTLEISEATMKKALPVLVGSKVGFKALPLFELKVELGSQEQTEVLCGLLRVRSSDEP